MTFQKTGPTSFMGVGLRYKHYTDVLDHLPQDLGWLEVHPENYFGGGPSLYHLTKIRALYPLSFHGVGLSLGSDQEPCPQHLQRLKDLINRFEPFQFSDHVSWSASGNAHLNDLLPLPYTQETLDLLCRNIDITQDFLGQRILVENPSTYIKFKTDTLTEPQLLNEITRKTGCQLLLDVNNVFVQSHNHGFDPYHYIDALNLDSIKEIHLAGHTEHTLPHSGEVVLIDTHNKHVRQEVWDLYDYTIQKKGAVHTMIEWDQDFPTFQELLDEARKASVILEKRGVKDVA